MRRGAAGHTLIEMVVTISVLAILASVILPLAATTRKREKEIELRRSLREIRVALDTYHELCRSSLGGTQPTGLGTGGTPHGNPSGTRPPTAAGPPPLRLVIEDDPGMTCWPKDLEPLVEGVETGHPSGYEMRFLRRIPKDPFNVSEDEHDGFGWVYRSSTDDPESKGGWNRQNVFDVRSASESQALDGSYYKDW